MEVVWLTDDDLAPTVTGTVYEELLALIPDTDETRRLAMLADHAGVMDFLGLELPEPGGPEDEVLDLFEEINEVAQQRGFAPEFPMWPSQSRDYISVIQDRFQYVGFEHWGVFQTAHAGVAPRTYDIAFGDFDPQRTTDALAACDCDQPDVREHSGVDYYAWGPEFIGEIEKRHGPPLYDHVGRGPRLLVREGEAFYSISNEVMEDLIGVSVDDIPSLADHTEYVEVARALASLGLMRNMTFVGTGLSADEVTDFSSGDQTLFQQTIRTVGLMREFGVAATGIGFDGEEAFTALVIANPDEETAEFNAERLIDRVWNVPVSSRSDDTLSDQLSRVEVAHEGDLVIARLYFRDPQRHLFGFPLLFANTLVIHDGPAALAPEATPVLPATTTTD